MERGVELEVVCRRVKVAEIMWLRCAVLRPAGTEMSLAFPGDEAAGTWHFGAFAARRNIGCLTLMEAEWEGVPALQLRGMAVAEDWQGRGVGRQLLEAARAGVEGVAGGAGVPGLWWCNARVEAVGFYERDGWAVRSEAFMIVPVGPHRKMVRIG